MADLYSGKGQAIDASLADFYSDMKSKPTRAMREAALDAEVGDEQKGEDPTTLKLCARVADLLGKEDAVFMASGTMCNEVGLNVLCRPGDEIICERTSHIINFEAGGPAALSGAMIHAIDGERGLFTADQVTAALRPKGTLYYPETAVVAVEQTANFGGGAIWPLPQLRAVAAAAKDAGVATHMDGARLLNACIATGISAKDYADGQDSVWIDFTKGLGAPMGAALAGSREFIARAWRVRQRIGGGLRQSGFMAATCLYALDHHVERLADDHALAGEIGRALATMPLVARVLPVETNIVIFTIVDDGPTAAALVDRLRDDGLRVGAFGERQVRIVTHIGVDAADGQRRRECLGKHLAP
jgi:threonine aldolase